MKTQFHEIDIFINIDDLDTHHYNPRLHTDSIGACTAGLHVYIVTKCGVGVYSILLPIIQINHFPIHMFFFIQ